MTIVEALTDERFLFGELWARSIKWRQAGFAVRILPGQESILGYGKEVEGSMYNGGNGLMDASFDTYIGEWGLVDKNEVIDARVLALNSAP